MLKRAYISAVHAVLAAPMHAYYATGTRGTARRPGKWQRWLASLGAVYHLDRMIALDIPWWNVAATDAVEQFLANCPNARVFEYGSGASTLWLARRAGDVTSVEHDDAWASRMLACLRDQKNARLIVAGYDPAEPAGEQPYVQSIANGGDYDLIVVDGRLRNACLQAAIPALKPGGIILFDDSGRQRYRPAIEGCDLAERRYYGLSYCVPYPDHSSILSAG